MDGKCSKMTGPKDTSGDRIINKKACYIIFEKGHEKDGSWLLVLALKTKKYAEHCCMGISLIPKYNQFASNTVHHKVLGNINCHYKIQVNLQWYNIGQFFCGCIECLCVGFLCLSVICDFWKALSIVSRCNLFLCCWCCSFLTCDNSLLFYFIRYIIGNYFVVVLSVYGCIYFSVIFDFCKAFFILSHCNLFLCWCCWFLTHDNSLCFISLGTVLEASNYFSLWLYWVFMCVFSCITLRPSWRCFLHHATLQLVSLLLLLLFFLTHGTHQTCGMSSDWSERSWQIYCN